MIGPYRLLSRLGRGGMARVYLALSPAGRLVAVKTILAERSRDEDFRRRFAREVQAARLVSGVFTAAVMAADPDADTPWLATAYVPAPSLREVVDECGPLPPDAVRWLAAGVAEALSAIHGAGLVHRDLAPGNILVTLDGPKVIDFGLALADDQDTANLVGTIAYMAPEQVEGDSGSRESDVYAMGATLLFAGTGHAPYAGSAMKVMSAVRGRDPDLTGLADTLAPLVESCLQRRAKRRPGTDQVVDGFRALLAGRERAHEAASWLPRPVLELLYEHERRVRPAVEAGPPPIPARRRVSPPEHDPAPPRTRPPSGRAGSPTDPTVARPAPAPTRRYPVDPGLARRREPVWGAPADPGPAGVPVLDQIVYAVPGAEPGAPMVLASTVGRAALARWNALLLPLLADPPTAGGWGPPAARHRSPVRFGPLAGVPTLIRRTRRTAHVLIAANPAGALALGPRHALALGVTSADVLGTARASAEPPRRLGVDVLDAQVRLREDGLRHAAGGRRDVLVDLLSAVLSRPDGTFALSELDGATDPEALLWGLCDLAGPLLPAPPTLTTLASAQVDEEPLVAVYPQWPPTGPVPGKRRWIEPGEELYSMGDVHRDAAEVLVRRYSSTSWPALTALLAPLSAYRSAPAEDRSRAVLRTLGAPGRR
jgi:hypothetical protein